MQRALVKKTLKTKLQGLMASGMDIDKIDQEVERYCFELYRISGYMLKEDDILEIYSEIAAGQ